MPFHVFAFTGGVTAAGGDTDVAAVTDTVLFVDSSSHFVMRSPLRLLAVIGMGATVLRARIQSGQLSYQGNPHIRPLNAGAVPPNNPNVMFKFENELVLPMGEAVQLLAACSAAGPEQHTYICVAADASMPLKAALRPSKILPLTLGYSDSDRELRGNIFPVRATSTTTVTANKWTQLTMSFVTALPGGIWEMYCSEHQSTNAQAHRWIFPFDPLVIQGGDRPLFRPGFASVTALTNRTNQFWYTYPWGTLGRFLSDVPPIPEVLCNGADASHELYLWLKKVQ